MHSNTVHVSNTVVVCVFLYVYNNIGLVEGKIYLGHKCTCTYAWKWKQWLAVHVECEEILTLLLNTIIINLIDFCRAGGRPGEFSWERSFIERDYIRESLLCSFQLCPEILHYLPALHHRCGHPGMCIYMYCTFVQCVCSGINKRKSSSISICCINWEMYIRCYL